MKKIALTLVAVSTLALAACQGSEGGNNTTANELNTTDEATNDVANGSEAQDALNTVVQTGSDAANGVGNVASDVGNAAADAVDANSASNAAR